MSDPIVEEVRKIRDDLAARFNYSPDAIFEHFKQLEKEHGWPLVKPPSNRIAKPASPQDQSGGRAA